jgi:ORF6N domain
MISLRAFDSGMVSKHKLDNGKIDNVENAICLIRGQRVKFDSDLAAIYGITTKRLNEQLKRSRTRFPEDFAFQLTAQALTNLKPQIATSRSHTAKRII